MKNNARIPEREAGVAYTLWLVRAPEEKLPSNVAALVVGGAYLGRGYTENFPHFLDMMDWISILLLFPSLKVEECIKRRTLAKEEAMGAALAWARGNNKRLYSMTLARDAATRMSQR